VNLLVTTAAKANSTEAALAVAVADIKALNDRITRLEALAPGIPEPGVIVNSKYLHANGKRITAKQSMCTQMQLSPCLFWLKVLNARFIEWVTDGLVLSASGITLRLRSGFTPLSVQYAVG
jgi:hypothetical protein